MSIVVKLAEQTELSFDEATATPQGDAAEAWSGLLAQFPFAQLTRLAAETPLADVQQFVADARAADPGADLPDISLLFEVTVPDGTPDAATVEAALLALLRSLPFVEQAEPGNEFVPAAHTRIANPLGIFQAYLADARTGLGADSVWNLPGGDGAGVQISVVDDLDFDRAHPDLQLADGSPRVQALTIQPSTTQTDSVVHSTGVLGVVCAVDNLTGGIGIAPGADVLYAGTPSRPADRAATSAEMFQALLVGALPLRAGDILTCSMVRGVTIMFPVGDQGIEIGADATIPMERDFAVVSLIRLMRSRGITVCLPAGNGLHKGFLRPPVDEPLDLDAHPEFAGRNSGAIVVGGLEPLFSIQTPTAPHGLQRWSRTTFGSRVNCCAWAAGVMTLSDSVTTPGWAIQSGTSFATPMVAGGLACLQGIARTKNRTLMPQEFEALVARADVTEDWAPGGKVGRFPQLAKMAAGLT